VPNPDIALVGRGPSWYQRSDGVQRVDLRWLVELDIEQLAMLFAAAERLGLPDLAQQSPARARISVRTLLQFHGTSVFELGIEVTDAHRALAVRSFGEPGTHPERPRPPRMLDSRL
jgi:hypothetical protein